MTKPFKTFLLIVGALPALISIGMVGIQLIGASSDAAYGIQIIFFAGIIATLSLKARYGRGWVIALSATAAGALASVMPLEVTLSALVSEARVVGSIELGDPYPDQQGTLRYWWAVGGLFVIHSFLIYAASLLVRIASTGEASAARGGD